MTTETEQGTIFPVEIHLSETDYARLAANPADLRAECERRAQEYARQHDGRPGDELLVQVYDDGRGVAVLAFDVAFRA